MHCARLSLLIAALILLAAVRAGSQTPSGGDAGKVNNTLAVQQAMAVAKQYLRDSQPKKAVELLEEHLPRISGNQIYLDLLRDAYRDYLVRLNVDQEPVLAQRYLQRLRILDPHAAQELSVTDKGPVKFEERAPRQEKTPLPNYAAHQANPPTKPASPASPPQAASGPASGAKGGIAGSLLSSLNPFRAAAKPSTFRGKVDEAGDDPFDLNNQRMPGSLDAGELATRLLARANQEFHQRRYKEARLFYEQAFQADQHATESCRDSWAYCMLSDVVEMLNNPGPSSKPLLELERVVRGAVAMAPKLSSTGQMLLEKIDERSKAATANIPAEEANLAIQHFGRNPQGWQVAETSHFRIFHNQQRDIVDRVAQVAERTRAEMSRKWFGVESNDWLGKCEIVLHGSAADYSRQTGVPTTSPGHSRIESDRTTHRVIGRRMDLHLDFPGTLETVLPHETTHVVIAGQFGPHQVPRWVDEGMAVLSEPAAKVEQHRQNLAKAARENQLFAIKELLELENYPAPRRISAFYAQSVGLVDFLAQQRGPTVFSDFVTEGLRSGWENALRKHYSWTVAELQQRWDAQFQGDEPRVTAGR